MRGSAALSLGFLALGSLGSCGARTGISPKDYGKPLDGGAIVGCLGDLDCGLPDLCAPKHCVAGTCVAGPVTTCDDGDACTDDRCAPDTGVCAFVPLALDEDGDGYPGPRPGYAPGDPGACGNDCNDASSLAHPGATEVCDGVDNDCNGIVDDGAGYLPSSATPLLLSVTADHAGLGGIAFAKSVFGVTFSGKNESWREQYSALDETGTITTPETPITHENTDAFTGPIVWTGKVFGIAWEDRRDGDFEIYFNRLDETGQKLSPDLRVTNAPNFSLRPDLVWDGAEFVVVWSDRRSGDADGRIFGQRIDVDGKLVGENVALTDDGLDTDAPRIARGVTELGLVYNQPGSSGRVLVYRSVSPDLATLGVPTTLSGGSVAGSAVVWSGDRYVVVWDTAVAFPGPAIYGAAVAPDGTIVTPERAVTADAPFARSEALLPLGDRLLLLWAEFHDSTYSIYSKMIAGDLSQLTEPARVTDGSSDAVDPAAAIGPSGSVAVAYEGLQTGVFQVYATRLDCGAQ